MRLTTGILVALCLFFIVEEIFARENNDKSAYAGVRRIRKRKFMQGRGGRPIKIIRKPQHQEEDNLKAPPVADEINLVPNQDRKQPIRRKIKIKRKKGGKNGALRNPSFVAPPPMKPTRPLDTQTMPPNLPEIPNNRSTDDSRFLSLFTIVSFKNEPCTSGSGNNGTCYSKGDCSKLGGVGSGSCASGFGVCCLFQSTCGDSTSTNCTYFQNRGYPSTFDGVGSCQLTINKANSNVCQLRLDFDNMILAQPEIVDHQCNDDQFIVSGGSPIPAICGTNNGLHLYVDMGLASNSPVVLTAVTGGLSFSRSFSVKVTQIECQSLSKASDGCLQYFTGVSGQILSFNYNGGTGLQLSETDYSVCVRMERNFCGIQYTACPDPANTPAMSFSITGSGNDGATVGENSCVTDWVTIPCATNTNDPTMQNGTPQVCVDRICGMAFNSVNSAISAPVNSFAKPFIIRVHTDEVEGNGVDTAIDTSNRGFCLDYIQQPCTSAVG